MLTDLPILGEHWVLAQRWVRVADNLVIPCAESRAQSVNATSTASSPRPFRPTLCFNASPSTSSPRSPAQVSVTPSPSPLPS
jgi:hypothetical protein